MFNYGTTAVDWNPTPQVAKSIVDYQSSSTLEADDQRRRRSGSNTAKKDGDPASIPNMHLVRRLSEAIA